MNDHDLIRRGDARRVMLAYASSYSAEQAETAIRALPAIVPQPAPRLPDLGAREAALREAAQCAIDNQDCSPWEISEAILNLIGKKPAGPYPAAPAEDVRAGALTLIAELTENRSIRRLARAALTDGDET